MIHLHTETSTCNAKTDTFLFSPYSEILQNSLNQRRTDLSQLIIEHLKLICTFLPSQKVASCREQQNPAPKAQAVDVVTSGLKFPSNCNIIHAPTPRNTAIEEEYLRGQQRRR